MRTRSVLLAGAILGAAVLGLAAPAYATSPSPSPSTPTTPKPSPSTSTSATNRPVEVKFSRPGREDLESNPKVAQGGLISVLAECGLWNRPPVADSAVLGRFTLTSYEAGWSWSENKRIPANAKPGNHVVKVSCEDGRTGQGTITVVAAQTKQKPAGGAETGAGGSAGSATTVAVAGIVATTMVGVGLVGYRRRRLGVRA